MNIFLFELIDAKVVNKTVKRIIKCQDDTIVVYINSEGGEGNCDYAIYEHLRMSGKKIITHAVDQVCSAAITIYLAGEERYATNYSSFLIHKPFHEEPHEKKYTEEVYEKNRKDLQSLTKDYFKLIADRSLLTTQRIRYFVGKARDGDWCFNSKDAKKFGLVTQIGFPVIPGAEEEEEEEKLTEEG